MALAGRLLNRRSSRCCGEGQVACSGKQARTGFRRCASPGCMSPGRRSLLPAGSTQIVDFWAPATSIRSVTRLGPALRSRTCSQQIGSEATTSYGLKYAIVLQGGRSSRFLFGEGENIDRATFGRKICTATCYAAIFNLACSSDQYSMSKRSASLIGVKQP